MEDQIVICAACNGKNRLPGSAVAASAKARCGHCGAALSPASIDEAAGVRAAVIEPAQKRRGGARWLVLLIVIAGGGAAYFTMVNRAGVESSGWIDEAATSPPVEPVPAPAEPVAEAPPSEPALDLSGFDFPPALPTTPEATDFTSPAPAPITLEPVAISPGLQNNWTGAEPAAPLSVVTQYGRNYYVKLVYANTNTEAVTFYLEGGSTAEFTVPLGSYELRYASGATWYGQADLFGPETSYAKAVGSFDFRDEGNQYSGYTVELILQSDGNLDTEGITQEQF